MRCQEKDGAKSVRKRNREPTRNDQKNLVFWVDNILKLMYNTCNLTGKRFYEHENQADCLNFRGKSEFLPCDTDGGSARRDVYLQKNKPKYKLVELESDTSIRMTDDEKTDFVAARVLREYRSAFEELAK